MNSGLMLAAALLLAASESWAQEAVSAPVPTEAATDVPQRPVRGSWTSDSRSYRVGDVITVLVDEYTLASAFKGNNATDARRRDLSVDGGADVGLPQGARIVGLPVSGRGAVGTQNVGESRQRGDATRENRFRSEMSVRVVSVEPNGVLRIEGTKLVNVDRNRQEVTLAGFIRPQDVTNNMVESWRIANAELMYTSKGSLGSPKSGIISRVLGWIWP